jgi:hypothetical protein
VRDSANVNVDIRLVECHSGQSIREGALPTNGRLTVEVLVALHTTELVARVLPKLTVAVHYKDQADKDAPAILVIAKFQLQYTYDKKPPNKKWLRHTLTNLGLMQSWPYFRELVQSQINRMGLAPVLLPLFVVPPQPDETAAKRGKPK